MVFSNIKAQAKEVLKGKWGKGALIILIFFAFEFALGFVSSLVKEVEFLNTIFSLANTIISVPISFGLIIAFMKFKKGEEVKCYDFFKLGFSNFARSWKIAGNILLKMWLPILLYVLAIIALAFIVSFGFIAAIATESNSFATIGLIVGIALVVASFIYLFVQSLNYTVANYVAIDNEQMSAKEAVEESKKLMKGYKGKYFLFQLSFIGWIILGAISLYIGFLWILPYIQIAQICFYEYLKENNKVEE